MARRSVFADRLLEFPDLVFSDGREFQHRGRWRDLFNREGEARPEPKSSSNDKDPARAEPRPPKTTARAEPRPPGRLILDLGCNDAALLASVATKHPSTNFIGLDWKPRVLHSAAERIVATNLNNVALLHARAQDIRRLFADQELDEIWLFHPEPLDTPRQIQNRLISETFLIDVHHVLRAGGCFILKTDHCGYFDAAIEVLDAMAAHFEITCRSSDFWNDSNAQPAVATRAFAGEMTAFEGRFVRKRKPIYFVTAHKRVVRP